jgi:hypothetical protein
MVSHFINSFVISTDKGMVGKKIKMDNILVRFEVLTVVAMKLTD